MSLGFDLWARFSLTHRETLLLNCLTDVTVADEYANTILTGNANRAFQVKIQ